MKNIIKRHWVKKSLWLLIVVFIFMNILAVVHSYQFTHFADSKIAKTQNPENLSVSQKIKTLVLGINNPRPENYKLPNQTFETIKLKSNKTIECWYIQKEQSKGTVLIFHGFGGKKSSMLAQSDIFLELGFNTLLVDFMGCGGSEGNQTSIGFFEAQQVKSCYDYIREKGEKNIVLYGTSMGSAAIMKALCDFGISPESIVIECPFGSMYETVAARFKTMKVPVFPMAGLLVFWGGVQNGFWAFGHQPVKYAQKIKCPTLVLYGAKDEKVSLKEINEIYNNLLGIKQLKIYPNAGHESYLTNYQKEWTDDVKGFLNQMGLN